MKRITVTANTAPMATPALSVTMISGDISTRQVTRKSIFMTTPQRISTRVERTVTVLPLFRMLIISILPSLLSLRVKETISHSLMPQPVVPEVIKKHGTPRLPKTASSNCNRVPPMSSLSGLPTSITTVRWITRHGSGSISKISPVRHPLS